MKYKFQVMVALTYVDKDIEVEIDLSDDEVARIKELVAADCEGHEEAEEAEVADEEDYGYESPQDHFKKELLGVPSFLKRLKIC